MISGETMKKKITVKQKHRYKKERILMYEGLTSFVHKEGCITLAYREQNNPADVVVSAYLDYAKICRKGEVDSELLFLPQAKSKGCIHSPYGDIEIEIYTHTYIVRETGIVIEYDIIINDEVSDGYRILWQIKED